MTNKKAVIYCRVSSDGQVSHGNGLDGQEAACRNYAKHKDIDVIAVFTDGGVSGALLEREGIRSLFDFVNQYNKLQPHPINTFLCEDIDRVARDITVHFQLKIEMNKRGLEFETTKMTFDESAMGEYHEGMMALTSQFYRAQNRERVIDKQNARLLDGYRPWGISTGYEYQPAPGGGKIIVRKEPEASIVADGLYKFANGCFPTIGSLAKFREEKGLQIKKTHKKGSKIYQSTVSRMLRNKLYTGYLDVNKYAKDKKTGRILHHWKCDLIKGRHEALVSLETHEKIIAILDNKNQPSKNGITMDNPAFPLRGKLACIESGLLMTANFSKGRNKSYPYYRFNHSSALKGKSIRAEAIHKEFCEMLCELKPKKELAKLIAMQIHNYGENENQYRLNAQKETLEKIRKNKEEKEKLIDKLLHISEPEAITKIEKRVNDLKKEIITLEAKEFESTPKVDKEKIKKGLQLFLHPDQLRE